MAVAPSPSSQQLLVVIAATPGCSSRAISSAHRPCCALLCSLAPRAATTAGTIAAAVATIHPCSGHPNSAPKQCSQINGFPQRSAATLSGRSAPGSHPIPCFPSTVSGNSYLQLREHEQLTHQSPIKILREFQINNFTDPLFRSFLCGDKRTKLKHPSLPSVSPRHPSVYKVGSRACRERTEKRIARILLAYQGRTEHLVSEPFPAPRR
jgi:hypothetical protein